MNYHTVSTSKSGHGAIFTNEKEAKAYQKSHPGSVYRLFKDRIPTRIPSIGDAGGGTTDAGETPKKQKTLSFSSDDAVHIYTDGSAIGNPGPGGYGVIILNGAGETMELSRGYRHTTNNRMEMMAVITALEALPEDRRNHPVVIHSDSQYTINGIVKGWAKGWRKRGWKKSDGKPALNPDLWARMLEITERFPKLTFKWVKGHAGDPLNERADALANGAAQGGSGEMLIDKGYMR